MVKVSVLKRIWTIRFAKKIKLDLLNSFFIEIKNSFVLWTTTFDCTVYLTKMIFAFSQNLIKYKNDTIMKKFLYWLIDIKNKINLQRY